MRHYLFRCDSSSTIGLGHLSRCLTLAESLAEKEDKITFVCRDLEGSFHQRVLDNGHSLKLLTSPRHKPKVLSQDDYISWLGVSTLQDAEETIEILHQYDVDLLIIDHYGIGLEWEKRVRPYVKKMLYIDDLADRQHDCDYLLNQAPMASELPYSLLLPNHTLCLTGLDYAMINPEITEFRKSSLNRRISPYEAQNALIAFGGGDIENNSSVAMEYLHNLGFNIDIITTTSFPHRKKLIEMSQRYSNIKIHTNITPKQVGKLICNADLAIGAAGGSALERCCLGLPTLTLKTAENQSKQLAELSKLGAIIAVESLNDKGIVELIKNEKILFEISKSSSSIIDGKGLTRIRNILK